MTISVVIPSCNGSAYIEQTIVSALDQQRLPDEIIVSDDNSSDNTLDICRKYTDRITIYTNPSGPSGFVNGWNRAIAHARGEYICILHQDDLLSPKFIRTAIDTLTQFPTIRHLFCTCHYIDASGNATGLSYKEPSTSALVQFSGQQYFLAYQQKGDPHIHRCPGVITHRSIFEQCCYEPMAGHIADDDFFYRVGMYTDVIGIMEPLASFRLHERSVTGGLEDAGLAGRLMNDYIYQCRQWKDHPFLPGGGYDFFTGQAHKYIRRYIGHGLREKNPWMILRAIHRLLSLKMLTSG
jgi:glycosyltransferase involved in cell wall biosynthesis